MRAVIWPRDRPGPSLGDDFPIGAMARSKAQQQRLGAPTASCCAWISSSPCNGSGSSRKLLGVTKDSKGWRIYSPPPHKPIQHLIKLQIKPPHTLFSRVTLPDGCFQPWVSRCFLALGVFVYQTPSWKDASPHLLPLTPFRCRFCTESILKIFAINMSGM